MGTARRYEPGTPSWVDLGTPDIDAAAPFSGGLFGWQTEDASPGEDSGGYRYFRLGGADVGGLGAQQGPGTPWSGYVAVEDADAAVARVKDLGGTVLAGPIGGVFGWTSQSYPYGEGGPSSYTEFATAGTGNVIAGMVQASDQWRTAGPAQWAVYFEVADTDATAAKALELGGSVGFEPYDIPHVGRLAV